MNAELLKSLWPAILIQFTLQIIALVIIFKNKRTRSLSPWLWAGIVLVGGLLGTFAFFFLGKEED